MFRLFRLNLYYRLFAACLKKVVRSSRLSSRSLKLERAWLLGDLRQAARDGIVDFAVQRLGLELVGLAESPIKGKEMGNIEYLSYWRKSVGKGVA